MSWKTIAVTVGVAAGLIGLLFATGTVSISGGDDAEDDSEEVGESEGSSKRKKGKSKRKGKGKGDGKAKGKRKRKGKRKEKKSKEVGDLDDLGYLGHAELREQDQGKSGVVVHEKRKTAGGLTLLTVAPGPKNVSKLRKAGKDVHAVRLLDIQGKVVHAWKPDLTPAPKRDTNQWAVAKLGPNGSLYVVHTFAALIKLDWDAKLLWRAFGDYHHDFSFTADGDVIALVQRKRDILRDDDPVVIKDNGIAIVDGETGKLDREIWLWDRFKHLEVAQELLKKAKRRAKAIDVLHANNLEFLPADSEGNWNQGDLLLGIRELDMIAVLDKDTFDVKWTWGPGELDKPHDPTMMADGNLVMLDNGFDRGYSRIVVIDPRKGNEIVWSYRGDDKHPFFTQTRGLVQSMPGGNFVVTSTQEARIFELNRDKKIVWEYLIPDEIPGRSHRVPFRARRLLGDELATAKRKLR